MTNRRFQLIDVFGEHSYSGNPLPVIINGEGLSTQVMQNITRWMNHSETTFLLPPSNNEADYRVRIFTLDREMPFAGHPTLGSCHAWLESGGKAHNESEIIQECGVGLVRIRRRDEQLAFAAPELIRDGPVEESKLEQLASVLQIHRDQIVDAKWADNGPGWIAILMESAQAVLDVQAIGHHNSRLDIGIVGPYPDGSPASFELRALSTDHLGVIREDPVTGSLNASVAQWLFASKRATGSYIASQGACVGSSGRIEITRDDDGTVWVGGNTATLVEGHIGI
jgi:PhzF family phenazine biosynthesis protein